ncbi:MAG: T9SS type A sorting domain-containing protein [Chitinophagaceae bacterium]|nr:T9SS type A sorting domain-containing protein [Chitinophagaceae bacterium]
MRTCFLWAGLLTILCGQVMAQRACHTSEYQQQEMINDPGLAVRVAAIETFIQKQKTKARSAGETARLQHGVIKIPVVVHILYHQPGENISDERVSSQIEMLNKCFRKQNADTTHTPAAFKALSADCEIEFQLAISDPRRRSTTGIIRKYTPTAEWQMDDKMKFSADMGDDAWDASSYLNIWVCNLRRIAGYASLPGADPSKDGIVIDYTVFGTNTSSGYEMGKTAVHEAAHWLGVKHVWGDDYCGDDLVEDTPKQGNYTTGCPAGIRVSCSNGPAGDMYMNYMDYTNDACINLFTEGQKTRMRTLFMSGGQRSALLASLGLSTPLIFESPVPDEAPRWLHPQIYPNPATNELTIDVAYDIRWIGKTITITDISGHTVMQVKIVSKIQRFNVSRLQTGMYFLSVRKEDGSYIKQKFIKM